MFEFLERMKFSDVPHGYRLSLPIVHDTQTYLRYVTHTQNFPGMHAAGGIIILYVETVVIRFCAKFGEIALVPYKVTPEETFIIFIRAGLRAHITQEPKFSLSQSL